MTNETRWAMLDQLSASGALGLPQGLFVELAERLSDLLHDKDPAKLSSLARQLSELVLQGGRTASPEAARAARQEAGPDRTPSDEAYTLGRLAFAHLLAAQAAQRRVCADFEEQLASDVLAPYVSELAKHDLTGVELAEILSQRPETISRNLKRLREIGAVDFRKEGTSSVNFLTPVARQVSDTISEGQARSRVNSAVRERMRTETRNLPKIFQAPPTFSYGNSRLIASSDNVERRHNIEAVR